jgi:hypothetical protein
MADYIDIVQAEIPSDVRSLVDSISATSRLMLTIDASHAGVVNLNQRLYRPPQVQGGAFSMIDRPFLKHHNDFDDPIGVVTDASYEDIATDEFRSAHPTYMQPEFWAGEVPWQDVFSMCPDGVGKLIARAQVTDKDAQEKILDRRFLRVSIKFRTDRMDCGCGKPKLDYWYEPDEDEEDDRFCSEIPGSRDKDGVLHFNMPNRLVFPHLSVVNEPADENAKILDSQFIDMTVWDRNGVIKTPRAAYSIPAQDADDTPDTPSASSPLAPYPAGPWKGDAYRVAEFMVATYRGEPVDPEMGDKIRRSFPEIDLDGIRRLLEPGSEARPATEGDLTGLPKLTGFPGTYIVELTGPSGSKYAAVDHIWARLSDLLRQDDLSGDGSSDPTGQPADATSEETPMTREELLKDETVKDLLAEAETRGKDSRDDEVAELTTKITTADEETQTVQTALDARTSELTEATDKLADRDKRTLVDKLIAIRVTLGDSDAKEKPEEAAEALMTRTTDSLRDAIADEEKRVPADSDNQADDQDDQNTLDDPGQPITGGDGKPPEDGEPKTRLGVYLDDVRKHSG